MNSKLLIRKAISMCLVAFIVATSSIVALANSERVVGELLISGNNINGQSPFVKVNGEIVQSGRSIFSSSTIVTPENASAIINLGKIGKIELAQNTTLALSFSSSGISGNLLSGRVTVLNSAASVNITTIDGNSANLDAGESATATSGKAQTASTGSSASIFIAVGIIAASLAAIIYSAVDDNSVDGGRSVSPTR